jgi:hypothetical protein
LKWQSQCSIYFERLIEYPPYLKGLGFPESEALIAKILVILQGANIDALNRIKEKNTKIYCDYIYEGIAFSRKSNLYLNKIRPPRSGGVVALPHPLAYCLMDYLDEIDLKIGSVRRYIDNMAIMSLEDMDLTSFNNELQMAMRYICTTITTTSVEKTKMAQMQQNILPVTLSQLQKIIYLMKFSNFRRSLILIYPKTDTRDRIYYTLMFKEKEKDPEIGPRCSKEPNLEQVTYIGYQKELCVLFKNTKFDLESKPGYLCDQEVDIKKVQPKGFNYKAVPILFDLSYPQGGYEQTKILRNRKKINNQLSTLKKVIERLPTEDLKAFVESLRELE